MASERILIIDDSKEVRDAVCDLVLRPGGYQALTADNGEDGLQIILEEKPDLVLLDERMPGMTGLEVLKALREQGVRIPVIFMTSFGSEGLAVQAFRLGVRDYLIKPFEPEEMERAIERVLTEKRLRAERDELMSRLQQANRRLERQLQEMKTLYTIGRSVISQLDLEVVLTRVVEAAVFLARAEEGFLLLVEGESGDLILRAAKNLDDGMVRELRMRVEDSLAGEVVRTGKPVVLGEGPLKVVTGYLANALAYIPVHAPDRGVIGMLGVTNRRATRTFTDHDVQLLSTLADYAAIALENARLYEEAETERRKLEAVLRETAEGVIVLDTHQRILLCNPTACAALGLPHDVVGRAATEVITNRSLQEVLRAAPKLRRTLRTEVAVQDGRTFNAQLSPVEGVGFVLMMQDITHLKELDRIKSEFVSTVSHDLRTPLTTILGYVSLLDRVGPLNEQQREFVQKVKQSIENITNLISDLLDLGRIEAGYDLEMEPLHLEEVISEAVESFRAPAKEKRQDLRWERRELPLVNGNPRRLRQVIDNLLSNAIKYTPEGGWVAVEAYEEDNHIVVRVADNGIGIPLEDQPYIFERFYRVESEETEDIQGTGLGLAIVKSVIERHGGRVWVESQPGAGTTFTFVLPIAA
ncbi:MAG TPA: response regulator [Anaerolineales bacterium]|nr:response regulator [Anaerolineales bacterium]